MLVLYSVLCSDMYSLLYSSPLTSMERGKKQVVYEEDDEEPMQILDTKEVRDETTDLVLIGRLWMERPYNSYALIETMKKLWSPSKGLTCQELGSNLISFQFYLKRDMERIQLMEPCHFNKYILVLTPLPAEVQPSMLKLDRAPCWIRLYDIPMRGRDNTVIRQIRNRFREILEMDEATTIGFARSVRMKVMLDLNNPLKPGTIIKMGTIEHAWIPLTYGRLSSLCYWCGKLGHMYKDCEKYYDRPCVDTNIVEKNMLYRECLKASPMKRVQVSPQGTTWKNEHIVRNLFGKADSGENEEKNNQNEATQISHLLKSLERVGVEDAVQIQCSNGRTVVKTQSNAGMMKNNEMLQRYTNTVRSYERRRNHTHPT